jgi:hypothetical protein
MCFAPWGSRLSFDQLADGYEQKEIEQRRKDAGSRAQQVRKRTSLAEMFDAEPSHSVAVHRAEPG